jgi:hypothetical protein
MAFKFDRYRQLPAERVPVSRDAQCVLRAGLQFGSQLPPVTPAGLRLSRGARSVVISGRVSRVLSARVKKHRDPYIPLVRDEKVVGCRPLC